MYNIETNSIFIKIITACRYFGMWGENEDRTTICSRTKKLLTIVYYISFLTSLASAAYLCEDLKESIFLSGIAITNAVLAFKLCYMCWRGKMISALLHSISKHSIRDHQLFIQINNKLENFVKFAKVFMLITGVALVYVCLPVFSSEKKLPFNIAFPLDWRTSEISYAIGYSFFVIASFMAFLISCFNVMIWYIMFNCSIKYQILGQLLRNIGKTKLERLITVQNVLSYGANEQEVFRKDLIDLIKTHQNIQDMIDGVKSLFSNLLLIIITTSGINLSESICNLAFSGNDSVAQSAMYLTVLSYNLFDIFMVMYLGNEIKLYSDLLSYCLFQSNWIVQSKKSKKYVVILMEILRRPHEIVICKLFRLNLQTFTSILNVAYSMFNILMKFK